MKKRRFSVEQITSVVEQVAQGAELTFFRRQKATA
jgi:hypothetical protein